MTKANCKTANCLIYKRLAEMQLSDHCQRLAVYAMRDAEAIADAVMWIKEKIAALGAVFPKLGFRH